MSNGFHGRGSSSGSKKAPKVAKKKAAKKTFTKVRKSERATRKKK